MGPVATHTPGPPPKKRNKNRTMQHAAIKLHRMFDASDIRSGHPSFSSSVTAFLESAKGEVCHVFMTGQRCQEPRSSQKSLLSFGVHGNKSTNMNLIQSNTVTLARYMYALAVHFLFTKILFHRWKPGLPPTPIPTFIGTFCKSGKHVSIDGAKPTSFNGRN